MGRTLISKTSVARPGPLLVTVTTVVRGSPARTANGVLIVTARSAGNSGGPTITCNAPDPTPPLATKLYSRQKVCPGTTGALTRSRKYGGAPMLSREGPSGIGFRRVSRRVNESVTRNGEPIPPSSVAHGLVSTTADPSDTW